MSLTVPRNSIQFFKEMKRKSTLIVSHMKTKERKSSAMRDITLLPSVLEKESHMGSIYFEKMSEEEKYEVTKKKAH